MICSLRLTVGHQRILWTDAVYAGAPRAPRNYYTEDGALLPGQAALQEGDAGHCVTAESLPATEGQETTQSSQGLPYVCLYLHCWAVIYIRYFLYPDKACKLINPRLN